MCVDPLMKPPATSSCHAGGRIGSHPSAVYCVMDALRCSLGALATNTIEIAGSKTHLVSNIDDGCLRQLIGRPEVGTPALGAAQASATSRQHEPLWLGTAFRSLSLCGRHNVGRSTHAYPSRMALTSSADK